MSTYPKVAIIYLSYHCEPYLADVLTSLKRLSYPKDKIEFVIVDNPHPEYGSSVRYISENILPLSGQEIPHVTLLPQKENIGFAGGNNAGAKWAAEHGFDYIFFHNEDGFLASDAISFLVGAMENNKTIGLAQSLMLLHPETELINSTGNSFHYLGFAFCDEYKTKIIDYKRTDVHEISYASGAAIMARADLVCKFGAWDADFFLYHEDLEWSFRLRTLGYKIVIVPKSIFYHKYQFSRSIQKFYWMERNRYGVMLMFYKLPTLILLLPMMLVMEVGLWIFAIRGNWLPERIKVYKYWLNYKNWQLWLGKRVNIQKNRKMNDRELLKFSVPEIRFQEQSMRNPVLVYFGNPLMKLYHTIIVKWLIRW